jgi:predicted alpha-1,2-mannosidase
MLNRRRPRMLVTAGLVLLLTVSLLALAPSASSAPTPVVPGDFATSFETADLQPFANTVETDAQGNPIQGNLSGSNSTGGLPGSLLSKVTAVTASAENPPNEVAANLKDGNPSTKWLAFNPTGWVTYQLSTPAVVVKYALTSANDSPGRDPRDFTLQGSNDGSTWADLDTRTGQTFATRFATNVYSFANTTAYTFYRLNITANSGDGLLQVADWDISDGSNTLPPPTPMFTVVGTGPVSGFNMKPTAGFTGLASLRYAGGAQGAGRSFATNKLYSVNVPVGPQTRLSYKVFPEFTGQDTQYPSTFVAVDLHFTDGTYLSQLHAIDAHGYGLTPAAQGQSKALYADQWNAVQSDIGGVASGKTIDRILVAYDDPAATANTRFQGWIDDIAVQGVAPAIDGSSLTNYVDTRRGTNSSGSFSRGNNLPITAVPNGFNFLTPVTDAQSNSWEYYYQQANNSANLPTLEGLAISHEPSPWMGDRNQMSVMPVPPGGSLTGSPASRALAFSHATEVAQPDYYHVALQGGLTADMTPTDHGGVFRFTFPAGSSLVFYNGTFTISGDTITGWVDNGSGLSVGRSRMFVYGTFDHAATTATATAATFDVPSVTLRLATSFLSVDQAHHNLDLELTGRSFEDVRAAAHSQWADRLGRIRVQGATESQLVTLYSNLYRLNLYPNSQSENTGPAASPHWQYASPVSAPTGPSTPTQTGAKIVDGLIYVNNGFWDTYRTVWPAYSLLYPDVAARIADGFVQQYRDGGWIARWSSPGYADLMTGTSSDVAMAEAYLNGVQLPDPMSSYRAAVKDATVLSGLSAVGRKGLDTSIFQGYTSTNMGESVSWALDGYVNDFGIGNMAAALASADSTPNDQRAQLREESRYFLQRAQNYVNMFDPATQFFQGRKPNGDFAPADPTVWGGAFTETDGWNFAFTAPQDGQGLADLYGGWAALEKKLDTFFATPENADKPGTYGGVIHEMREAQAVRLGQLGMSNQPSHHIPYMYDYVGAPAKTQKLVREILQRLYVGSEIGQGYPGDEDNGEMSSWYILSSLGLYPLQAGSPNWVIGSPSFQKATVHRSTGDIVINAANNSASNVYVRDLRVNGKAQNAVWIDSATLAHGGTLDFTMGATPSTWGTHVGDAPPSLTNGNAAPKPLQDTTGPGLGTATGPDGLDAAKLFDNSSTTQLTLGSSDPEITWGYRGDPQRPMYYTITSGAAPGDAAAWTLLGSNDATTWTTLDSRSGQTFQWRNQTRPFAVAHPGTFRYFRLSVTSIAGAAQLNLAELELLSGGDVTIGGGPLTVAPAAQIDGVAGRAMSGSLATVTGGTGTTASDYTATVDWGDGTAPTIATMGNSSRGVFAVTGTHTYSQAGYYQVGVTVSDGQSQGAATASVNVVFAAGNGLTASFDTVCIGDDGMNNADCDGGGFAYSRTALSTAGVVQGQQDDVPGTGLRFTLPATGAGQPDDATGNGKTIAPNLAADATHLSFIGAGTEGNQDTTATVTFTDGTTTTTPIQFSDWTLGGNANGTPAFGNIVVAKSAYRLHSGAQDADVPFLFSTVPFAIPAGKQVASVTLPSSGAIHLFAIADDGTPAAPLTLSAPANQAATAGAAFTADLGTVAGGSAPYQARVQWGDGSVTGDATVAASGAITATHTYGQPGTYTVHVTGIDAQGSVVRTFTVTVSAAAAHTAISLSPASGVRPGGTVSVTGSGFAPGDRVTVHLGGQTATSTVTMSSAGGFTAALSVPRLATADLYSVTAQGARSAAPATATIGVQAQPAAATYRPHLVVSPTSGPRGTAVTINGDSFAPRETITLRLGSASVTARSDAHGVLTNARLSVAPNASTGAASVTASGTGSAAVSVPFEVTAAPVHPQVYRPRLELAPSASGVTAHGHGFAPDEQVAFSVDGHRPVVTRADAAGNVAGVPLTADGEGGHWVNAAGIRSLDPAHASFVVLRGRTYAARPAQVHGAPSAPATPGGPTAGPSGPSGSPGPSTPSRAAPRGSDSAVLLWWLIAPAAILALAGAIWWRRRSVN